MLDRLAALFALLLLAWPGVSPADAQPQPLAILSGRPAWAHGVPFFATRYGLWEKYGLKVDHKGLESSKPVIEALASGQGDIAFVTTAVALNAIEKGVPVMIVSGAVLSDYMLTTFRADVAGIKDLKGKKVATWSATSDAAILLNLVAARQGLVGQRDYQFVVAKAPDIVTVLQRGDADVGLVYDPFATVMLGMGARRVSKPGDLSLAPPAFHPSTVVLAANKTLKERPEAVRRYLGVHAETARMIREKPGEAAIILTDLTRQPLEVVRESYKNVTLTLDVDRAYLQRWADILLEQKVMEQRVDVSRAVDTSLQPR